MKHTLLCSLFAVLLAAPACRSSKKRPPAADDSAQKIAAYLEAGQIGAANTLYVDVSGNPHHRDAVYATVYDRAQRRYARADYKTSATMLRFLMERFPKAEAPREALLYTLFLERTAARKPPAAKQLDEMERLAALVRRGQDVPVWVDLVSAQVAIDRNDLDGARASYRRFKARWDGHPAVLRDYVTSMDRYLGARS